MVRVRNITLCKLTFYSHAQNHCGLFVRICRRGSRWDHELRRKSHSWGDLSYTSSAFVHGFGGGDLLKAIRYDAENGTGD